MMGREILALTAVFGGLFCQASEALPSQAGATSLTVSVFNDAEIPPPVLRTARTRAEAVFEEAGIALTWLDCGTPGHWVTDIGCGRVIYPTHLSVRLVTDRRQRSKDIFGESFLDDRGEGNYACVYFAPVAAAKALAVVSLGELLGYIVVHELGHLLLGKDSHSSEGVMRPVWQFEDLQQAARGRLGFTSRQGERMRGRYLSASLQRSAPHAPGQQQQGIAGVRSLSATPLMARLTPPSEW
jgi:hypothetical protein